MELNSAGQSPTPLVFKTVPESWPLTRLLNSLVFVIHAPHESGRDSADGLVPGYLVYDYLGFYLCGGFPLTSTSTPSVVGSPSFDTAT